MLPPARSAVRLAASLAVVISTLGLPSAVSAATPAFSPDNPHFAASLKEEKKRAAELSSGKAKAERERSRQRYRGLSAAETLTLGRKHFPEAFSMELFDGENLGPDVEIVDYTSRTTAIGETDGGKRILVQSTSPLRATDSLGNVAPVDHDLKTGDGAFATANATTDLIVDDDVEDGTTLAGEDLTITPAGARQANGQSTRGRVYFHAIEADTGYIVVPQPGGTEVGWLLSSSSAPERFLLDVDMPTGASLRRSPADETTIPGDPPKSLQIVRDGKILFTVLAPIAYDANRAPIKTELSIVGTDRIAMTVEHKDQDLEYPLYADPAFVNVADSYATNWSGWMPWFYHGSNYTSTYNYYGSLLKHPAYNPYGIHLSMPQNTTYQPHSTSVNWGYRAPADTSIWYAGFGHVSLNPLQSSWQWYNRGYRFAWLASGFQDRTGSSWEPNQLWSAQHDQAGSTPQFNGFFHNSDARTAWTFHHCYQGCTPDHHGTEQNIAVIGLNAWNTTGNNANIGTGDGTASVGMNHASINIADDYNPAIIGRSADRDWRNDDDQLHTLPGVSTSDRGLGMKSATLTGAAWGNGTLSHSCTGHPQASPCPKSWTVNGFTYKLNEGVNTMSLRAADIVDNTSTAQTWTEKIDRSAPTVNLSGALSTMNGPSAAGRHDIPAEHQRDRCRHGREVDQDLLRRRRRGRHRADLRSQRRMRLEPHLQSRGGWSVWRRTHRDGAGH